MSKYKFRASKHYKDKKIYLSATALENLDDCGHKFRLRNIEKVPVKKKKTMFSALGSAFHWAAENMYNEAVTLNKKILFNRQRLLGSWSEYFNQAMADPEIEKVNNEQVSWLKQQGYPILQRFFTKESEDRMLKPAIAIEKEFKFPYKEIDGYEIFLVGKIDRIIEGPDPNKDEVEITDYKTAKSMDIDKDKLVKNFQAVIYSIAYRWLHKNFKKEFPILEHYFNLFYVRHGVKIKAYIKKEHRIAMKKKIDGLVEKLIEGDLRPEPSLKACKYCDYKQYCPKKGGTVPDYEALRAEKNKDGKINLGDLRVWYRDGLKMEIKEFQVEDVKHMAKHYVTINANQVGTGKTVEGIALAEHLTTIIKDPKILLIAPKPLLFQWADEIRDWTGKKGKLRIIYGSQKERRWKYGNRLWTIVNYEKIISDIVEIRNVIWDLIILDEAQRVKGTGKAARLIRDLSAKWKVAMSGTPIGSRLDNLYRVMSFVKAGLLGAWSTFQKEHFVYDDVGQLTKFKDLDKVREKLGPHLIRRKKSEVWKELPEPQITPVVVEMSARQRALYEEDIDELENLVLKGSDEASVVQFLDTPAGGKYTRIRRMLDFTHLIDKAKFDSPKYDELKIKQEEILENGDKHIIFSQYITVVDELEKQLKKDFPNEHILRITGDRKKDKLDRDKVRKLFRNDKDYKILLCTDAAKFGLNLQSASYLSNFECPMDPEIISQRVGRVVRPGMARMATIYNYLTKGTIEVKIHKRRYQRAKLSQIIIDNESEETEVEIKDIKNMMSVADLREILI